MSLFAELPEQLAPLPSDELRLLHALPTLEGRQALDESDWLVARRLERRGLVKISRDCGMWWAGKTRTAVLRNS